MGQDRFYWLLVAQGRPVRGHKDLPFFDAMMPRPPEIDRLGISTDTVDATSIDVGSVHYEVRSAPIGCAHRAYPS